MKNIRFFDTTMRDGEQGIGYLLTTQQKLTLLQKLSQLNVAVIELGMVTADQDSQSLFEQAIDTAGDQNVAALCRLHEVDIQLAVKALSKFRQSTLNLLCIGSEIHLNKKMGMSAFEAGALLDNSLAAIRDAQYAGNIYAILEDSTRGSETLLHEQIQRLIKHGIKDICLADTVGAMTPSSSYAFFSTFIRAYPDVRFSTHFHNDLGMAVANTICAIDAGVHEVQVTLGGIGERCGNASFEEVVAILSHCEGYKGQMDTIPALKDIVDLCRFFYQILGREPNTNKPIIGANAFLTCAGIHQSAILKHPETYEFINPESLGMQRGFHINRLSSRKLKQCSADL
jgi:2-isopropylmalate synthase